MYSNKISCSAIAGDGDDRGDSIAGESNDGGSRYAKIIWDSCGWVTGSI